VSVVLAVAASTVGILAFYFVFALAPVLATGLFFLGWWALDSRRRVRGARL